MTKVTLHYPLTRPLQEEDLENVARVHSTYGMSRLRVESAPGGAAQSLTVDYDASRLMKKDVEAVLMNHGIPIQIPPAV